MKILKNGSLRFWGDWFGRPYDNFHKVISADYDEIKAILVIRFDNEEKCTVYDPKDIINNNNDFHVTKAARIIFEWYFYGAERIPQNLCKITYSQTDDFKILKEYSGSIRDTTKCLSPHDYFAFEIC